MQLVSLAREWVRLLSPLSSEMAKANYDPKVSTVVPQYVTPTANAKAFPSAYNQTLTKLSPFGVKVQAGGAAWPA